MTQYRLYTLSSERRKITGPPEIVDCTDDAAAVERATQLLDGHAIEVWESARLIVRLEPKTNRGSPPPPPDFPPDF